MSAQVSQSNLNAQSRISNALLGGEIGGYRWIKSSLYAGITAVEKLSSIYLVSRFSPFHLCLLDLLIDVAGSHCGGVGRH